MKHPNTRMNPPKYSRRNLQAQELDKLFLIDFGSQKESYGSIRKRLLQVFNDTPAIRSTFPYGKQTYYVISDPKATTFDLWLFVRRIFPKKRFLVIELSLEDYSALNAKLNCWLRGYQDYLNINTINDLPF